MSSQKDDKKSNEKASEKVLDSSSSATLKVTNDVLPLVVPSAVLRSSKDPNRGLYPRKKRNFEDTSDCAGASGTQVTFRKASELYKAHQLGSNSLLEEQLNEKCSKGRHNRAHTRSRSAASCSKSSSSASSELASSSSVNKRLSENKSKKKKIKSADDEVPTPKINLRNYFPSILVSKSKNDQSVCDSVNSCSSNSSSSNTNTENDTKKSDKTVTSEIEREHELSDDELYDLYSHQDGIICYPIPERLFKDDDDEVDVLSLSLNSKLGHNEEIKTDRDSVSLEPPCKKLCPSTKAECCENSSEKQTLPKTESLASTSQASNNECETVSESKTEPDVVEIERNQEYYFGLFGSIDDWDEDNQEECYFQYMPITVMEQILSQIPFLDLMAMRRVCKSWNEIISNKKFLEWKKTYYNVKFERYDSQCWQEALSKGISEANISNCFSVLIRFMSTSFPRRPPSHLKQFLSNIPIFADAERVILERFPEWTTENVSPWSIFAATVIFSNNVKDLYGVFRCVIRRNHSHYEDILEAMHCIATILLHFMRTLNINHGLHHRLYHTIYMIENKRPSNSSMPVLQPHAGLAGQQHVDSYFERDLRKLTYEQIRVLNHRLQPNQRVKIVAFAGTGKTSTLSQYARLYPNLKFLNVMFNRAVCNRAMSCFPPNVECRTAHSLAYQAIGKKYRYKLSFKIRPHDLLSHMDKPANVSMHMFSYCKYVLLTIENFTSSADEQITTAHVPRSRCHNDPNRQFLLDFNEHECSAIAASANHIWQSMISLSDNKCRITHDVYLKLYQLSHPSYSAYDCIMVDEAQDCNAAMIDIMLSQKIPVILVGDPNQQIYSFRGASNALQNVKATHVYYLTKSFRFGADIAYVASCCLEVLKGNTRATLIGGLKESYVDGHTRGQYAVIARTNEKLFAEAVRFCCTNDRKSHEPRRVQGAFAGGIDSYGFSQMIDIFKLRCRSNEHPELEIKDRFIKKFQSFNDLYIYAQKAEDCDMMGKIDMVCRYGDDVLEYIRCIQEKCKYPIEMANIVFSTAHKAKGMEFDTVALTNDYGIGNLPKVRPSKDPQSFPFYTCLHEQLGEFWEKIVLESVDAALSEEYNVLYVALTRAKKCLLINEKLYHALILAQEKFEHPVMTYKALDSAALKCVTCSTNFVPHSTLTLRRRRVVMASGREVKGGPLCPKCATLPYYVPQIHEGPAVLLVDHIEDPAHCSMMNWVGPLPHEPPIKHDLPPAVRMRVDGDFDALYIYMVQPRIIVP